jgi:release factor glutamine methyltransferase
MTIQEAQQRLLFRLYDVYDNREAMNIADLVMDRITGWKKIDRIVNKHLPLLPDNVQLLEEYTNALLAHKPVQYVLNEVWFYGLKFFVNEQVLIPRPETEELVEWIQQSITYETLPTNMKSIKQTPTNNSLNVLDIGTGSGCIPISLKKKFPDLRVYACDISKSTLDVAQKNASIHQTDISFLKIDFLDPSQWSALPRLDIIISNPPYIPLKDRQTMRENVLQYEPHIALFVEDNDPLIFYRAIADFATEKMVRGGNIFVEINEDMGKDVKELFVEKGFEHIEVKKDMQGKDRMARVIV